jgi:hypothetical protein
MKELPIYRVVFDEKSEMIVNSLVDVPAHLRYFIAQSDKNKLFQFAVNDEKREITGVVISANQPIYYYSEQIPECYMIFDPRTIRQIALYYFAHNKANLIDIQHDFNIKDNAVTMLESYFTDENKKSQFDVEPGSWIMTYKVNDDDLWKLIKEGKIRGFSIAGNFNMEKMMLNYKTKNQNAMKTLKEKIMALFAEQEQANIKMIDVTTVDGKQMRVAEDLIEGAKLYVVASDGTEILAPAGEYMINYNNTTYRVVVNELGVITGIEEVVQQEAVDYMQEIEKLRNEMTQMKQEIEEMMTAMAMEMRKKMKFNMPSQQMVEKKKEIRIRV